MWVLVSANDYLFYLGVCYCLCACSYILSQCTPVCLCVFQVYRSVLISGRRRRHSASSNAHKQTPAGTVQQDPGALVKKMPRPPTLLDLGDCNPSSLPQQVATAARSQSGPAAPCQPPSLAAPRPRPPAGRPPRRARGRGRRMRGRSGSSEETSFFSTTASTSSRCGTLRSSTRRRYGTSLSRLLPHPHTSTNRM